MITVRFPNGFSVQYNDANHAKNGAGITDLYTSGGSDQRLIAQVPNTCIIEWATPCRVYNALAPISQASIPNRYIFRRPPTPKRAPKKKVRK